jgi:hypothetical protein
VIDKTKNEALALEHASLYAGEFMQEQAASLGTDLAKWPRDAWMTLVECAVTGFVERMQELKNVPSGE